jgi:heme/copper-type cytochrome/quinol oxidase subunit 4
VFIVNQEQAATMLQVFPVLLLAAILENTRVHVKLRRRRWYRGIVVLVMAAGLIGLITCFFAFMTDESDTTVHGVAALFTWIGFPIVVAGVFFELIAIVATQETQDEEDERARAAQPQPGRAALLRAFLRGRLN